METINQLYQLFCKHQTVSTDSRKIIPGSIFFALRGEHFDGNRYAKAALDAGAVAVVVDDPHLAKQNSHDNRYILVANVLKALQALATLHRHTSGIPVIGITGTNGKTTTKELVASVLRQVYRVLYTQGNLNNQIGVPLTLLSIKPEHQIAIVEMGASQPGDIAELCKIAAPNYGLITNIGCAHIQGFGSIESIRQTKGELYNYLRTHNGYAFVHADDQTLMTMAQGIPSITYGSSDSASFRGYSIKKTPFTLSFRWQQIATPHDVCTQLVGDYNLPNALVAVALGRYFDVATGGILKALEEYSPSNNRSQLIHKSSNTIIVDAYNANPSSMHTALKNFAAIDTNRCKVLILGDMMELGDRSLEEHRVLLQDIALQGIYSEVFLIGSLLAEASGSLPQLAETLPLRLYANTESLAKDLGKQPLCDKLILIKGSRSIGLEKLIGLC